MNSAMSDWSHAGPTFRLSLLSDIYLSGLKYRPIIKGQASVPSHQLAMFGGLSEEPTENLDAIENDEDHSYNVDPTFEP